MSDTTLAVISASFLSALLVSISVHVIPGTAAYKYDQAIKLCEKDLPRNQTCEITAIVKGSK